MHNSNVAQQSAVGLTKRSKHNLNHSNAPSSRKAFAGLGVNEADR